MSKAVIVLPDAEADIADTYDYYERQRYGLGNEFIIELENYILKISLNPFLFPQKHQDYRSCFLKRFPFCIYYLVNTAHALIWAVVQTSRDLQKAIKDRDDL